MSVEQKTIELLYWVKDLGLTPKKPRRSDRFLNPYTSRIVAYSPKRHRQLEHLLWIPTEQGVRAHLPYVKVEKIATLTTARAGRWVGAGPGESEALLSLFNIFRGELTALSGQQH
jgi:hypothetical protein